MENFFTAALTVIAIPYGLMFLVLLWNMIGPLMRARNLHDVE